MALIYRRDIRPHLPLGARRSVLEIGCGHGELVRLLRDDDVDATGIDISPEQVSIARAAGLPVELGDFHVRLTSSPGTFDAVLATDVLEHLDKEEVLRTFDDVHTALKPGGVFIARVPNAVSPLGGDIMYGDITHETWFTKRSVTQLARLSGFSSITTLPCPPVAHGIKSAARVIVWKVVSGMLKLALTAETGEHRGHITTQNLTFIASRGRDAHA
jgi:SAM-dependent methyltransferase